MEAPPFTSSPVVCFKDVHFLLLTLNQGFLTWGTWIGSLKAQNIINAWTFLNIFGTATVVHRHWDLNIGLCIACQKSKTNIRNPCSEVSIEFFVPFVILFVILFLTLTFQWIFSFPFVSFRSYSVCVWNVREWKWCEKIVWSMTSSDDTYAE